MTPRNSSGLGLQCSVQRAWLLLPVEKYFPNLNPESASSGESFLLQWSQASCFALNPEAAQAFQAAKNSIHAAFIGGKDSQGYWLRLLSVRYDGGQFWPSLHRFLCDSEPLLVSAGGSKVQLDTKGDPYEFIKQVIGLGGESGGPINEMKV